MGNDFLSVLFGSRSAHAHSLDGFLVEFLDMFIKGLEGSRSEGLLDSKGSDSSGSGGGRSNTAFHLLQGGLEGGLSADAEASLDDSVVDSELSGKLRDDRSDLRGELHLRLGDLINFTALHALGETGVNFLGSVSEETVFSDDLELAVSKGDGGVDKDVEDISLARGGGLRADVEVVRRVFDGDVTEEGSEVEFKRSLLEDLLGLVLTGLLDAHSPEVGVKVFEESEVRAVLSRVHRDGKLKSVGDPGLSVGVHLGEVDKDFSGVPLAVVQVLAGELEGHVLRLVDHTGVVDPESEDSGGVQEVNVQLLVVSLDHSVGL